ncbi:hypothetical protein F5X96DRAFT_638497 [Biscogniauxia mediterranea]|nr:hypothetical protein F5X96DRAFT_638497 [Biscogniauxia mediterranea]
MDSPEAAGFSAAHVLLSLSYSGRINEQQHAAACPHLTPTPMETSVSPEEHSLSSTDITASSLNQSREVEIAKLESEVTSLILGLYCTAQTTTITTAAHPNAKPTRKSTRRRSRMVRRLCRPLTKYLPRSGWRFWPEAHRVALVNKLAQVLCTPCPGGSERGVRARLERLFLVALAGDEPVDFAVYDCLQMERGLDWLIDRVFRAKPTLAPSWWRRRADHLAALRRLEEQLARDYGEEEGRGTVVLGNQSEVLVVEQNATNLDLICTSELMRFVVRCRRGRGRERRGGGGGSALGTLR